MSKTKTVDIAKLAKLSNLKVSKKEEKYFEDQFEETLKIIEKFEKLDTSKVEETYIVTGTKNVVREDKINPLNILTQQQALSNAKKTHNGYFVVGSVLNK